MKWLLGESTGTKFSPATASCLLKKDPLVLRNWSSRLAVCEAACKKEFTIFTNSKKLNDKSKAKTTLSNLNPKIITGIEGSFAESLGLNSDGSELLNTFIESDDEI